MDARERLIAWMKDERVDLLNQIALFSSGRAQMREYRDGTMLDTTGEALTRLQHRQAELDRHLADFGAKFR